MKIVLWNLFLGYLGGKTYFFIRKHLKNRKKESPIVKEYSNVIQYDGMGYPLRLVIMSDGNQVWKDTYEQESDVVLKWKNNL